LQTILPYLFRKIKFIAPQKVDIDTPDDNFFGVGLVQRRKQKLDYSIPWLRGEFGKNLHPRHFLDFFLINYVSKIYIFKFYVN
jgi:hypothetical protein